MNKFQDKNLFLKLLFTILIALSLIQSTYSACNPVNCPPLRGVCSGNECICEEGYITVNNKKVQNNGVFCNYHTKSRFIAFLLEFFFPFGVGHFYSGNMVLAVIKLALFVVLICTCCAVLCCVTGKVVNTFSFVICVIVVLCIIGIVFMEVFDLFCYAFGFYKDGNGVKMS